VSTNAGTSSLLAALAAAFAVGVVLARVVDRIGHGHPHR
jgi:hypothetical protein